MIRTPTVDRPSPDPQDVADGVDRDTRQMALSLRVVELSRARPQGSYILSAWGPGRLILRWMQPTAGGDEESIAYIYLDDGDAITTAEFADAHPEAMDLLEGAGLELDVVDALMSPARHRAPEIW